MQAYSLDYLMSEVNRIVGKPSVEEIRISVMQNVRFVLRDIGYELICDEVQQPIQVLNNRFRVPDAIVDVIDVAFSEETLKPGHFGGHRLRAGQSIPSSIAYYKTPLELRFPNFEKGTLWIKAYAFYTDEEGELLIPESIYKACYDYCVYEAICVLAHRNHPQWQERPNLKYIADQSIYKARGFVNEYGPADFRTMNRIF